MNNLQLLLRGEFYIAASSGKLFHPAINLKCFFFSCFETPNFKNSCCLHLKEHSINKPSMKLHKCGKLNNVSRHKETDIWTGLGVKFFEGFSSDQNQSKNTAISLSSVRAHSHSSLPLCCSWRLLEADLGFHSHALTCPDLWNPLLFASPILQSPSSVSRLTGICEQVLSSVLPINDALCDPLWSSEAQGRYLPEKYRSKGYWEVGQSNSDVMHLLLWGCRKNPLSFTHPNFLFH